VASRLSESLAAKCVCFRVEASTVQPPFVVYWLRCSQCVRLQHWVASLTAIWYGTGRRGFCERCYFTRPYHLIQHLMREGTTTQVSGKPSQCLGRRIKPSFALAGNRSCLASTGLYIIGSGELVVSQVYVLLPW
jgi:hypothetical protein